VSPRVLAVDSTGEHGSIALWPGEEIALEAPGGFAHIIYGELEKLLARHRVKLSDIDCFAAASGPGSFTGVRVGLACIKGLAEALNKPAVAISNSQAISTFGTAPLRAVEIDARRGEIYGAVYDDTARLVQPEVVTKREIWLAGLPAGVEFVEPPRALAGAVARLALDRYLRGEPCDPAALDANYVRRSDAELLWRDVT
jgi:tRNA threonylcarbamoyladenosine biosynthesis protein TsaB